MYKRILTLVISLILILSCAACSSKEDNAPANAVDVTTGKAGESQFVLREIDSSSLAGSRISEPTTRKIAVYLPKSYIGSKTKYPVVYFLTGFGETYSNYQSMFKTLIDKNVNDGKIKEMIIVIIEGKNKLGGSFYVNSPVTGNWEDYVVKDVVKYVDANFRTIKDKKARAITGHSMGGFGALNIALHSPDVFSCVYGMNPGLFDPAGINDMTYFRWNDTYVKKLTAMSKEEADKSYSDFMKTTTGMASTFAYAYGSAFSPDAEGIAPYIKYPALTADGKPERSGAVWEAWDNGFGGLEDKIKQYKSNLKKLTFIGMEYAESDSYAWIPRGTRYYSELLKKEGLDNTLLSSTGGHDDQVSPRFATVVLPLLSEKLSFK